MINSSFYYTTLFWRWAFSCWLIIGTGPYALAQNIQFERIPNELGLSQNFIGALCEDHHGFLWVGTKDGLNRFDGHRFKVYQHDPFDSTSISNNFIKCILEDSQNRLWVGTANGLNLFDPQREVFQHLLPHAAATKAVYPNVSSTLSPDQKRINTLLEDHEGNIWIGTNHGGVVKMTLPPNSNDLSQATFTSFVAGDGDTTLWDPSILKLEIDQSGMIWVRMEHTLNWIIPEPEGSYRVQRVHWSDFAPQWPTYRTEDLLYRENGQTRPDERFHSIFSDAQGNVWLKSAGGFARWEAEQKRFVLHYLDLDFKAYARLPLDEVNADGIIDRQGFIWAIGTSGLVLYDTLSHRIPLRHHFLESADIGIPLTGMPSILEDRVGNIWIGTGGYGLFRYSPQLAKFGSVTGADRWQGYSIRTIYQTSDSLIWLGTTDIKLLQYNRQTGITQPITLGDGWEKSAAKRLDTVYAMQEDAEGNLWIGGNLGLFRISYDQARVQEWTHYPVGKGDGSRAGQSVTDLHINEQGQIWIMSHYEFGRFDPESGEFFGYPYLAFVNGNKNDATVPKFFPQGDGIFWLGTNEGLLRFDAQGEAFHLFGSQPTTPNSLSHPLVKCILPDPQEPDRILWIGTGGGGLNRFDQHTGTFTHYKKRDGLPDNVIYGILPDETGQLWLSTNQGISAFDPEQEVFRNYDRENGLQDNEFNSGAFFQGASGELFFGGIHGFNSFYPANIRDNSFQPQLVFTDLKLANQSMDHRTPQSPLRQSIVETDEVRLSWKDKIVTLEFAALDLTAPNRIQYAYRLAGFDEDWQYIGNQRSATLTNISPGTYRFELKATNHDGVWTKQPVHLTLIVSPPWWQTWWAYLTYLGILGLAIFGIYRFQLERQLAKGEALRLAELNRWKTRFYTNITHEFRTPLTVIQGMTEQIEGHRQEKQLIQRNTRNLLRLINQLLDLSKLESGRLQLQVIQADIIAYLQYLTESFYSLAQEKDIRLVFYPEIAEQRMDFDENRIQHIVYNLLSNAIKFTPAGGRIVFHAKRIETKGKPFLLLHVKDTGLGIPAGQLDHVFDRFFQADDSSTRQVEGTGIGLALTKELIESMGGQISVKSELGKGTTFTIHLPIRQEASLREFSPPPSAPKQLPTDEALAGARQMDPQLPLVLIVEDNRDVTTYIRQILQPLYRIETAADGQAGIEKALELVPDVIISDIMMPEKDGLELTAQLKTDERSSHIPIILLTAKATDEDKMAGLQTGADAYLMKPFHKEELLIRIQKLLELRQQLQRYYQQPDGPAPTPETAALPPTLDDLFIQKIRQTIEDKISDSDLGVKDLCQAVNLSHTQVFRKMKALTGENPTHYIRKMRLARARRLLQNNALSIAEVAYQSGFTDPNYFSRVFREEFGDSPSAMRK